VRRAVLVLAIGPVLLVLALRARRAESPPARPRPTPAVIDVRPAPPPAPAPKVVDVPLVTKRPGSFVTPPPPVEAATSSVWGVVTLMGERPKRRRIRLDDPRCAERQPEGLLSDDLVAGPNQELRWTMVYVTKGLGERAFDPPAVAARLEAVGCRFEPHVLVAGVEQPVEFVNLDAFDHNVHGLPFVNREFNVILPPRETIERRFPKPEMIKVRSGIHPWMSAWIGVFGHPFVAVTGEDGVFRIPGLPPGRYEITTWHEGLKSETRDVAVEEAPVRLDFLLRRR
jgi:hypothetical protein